MKLALLLMLCLLASTFDAVRPQGYGQEEDADENDDAPIQEGGSEELNGSYEGGSEEGDFDDEPGPGYDAAEEGDKPEGEEGAPEVKAQAAAAAHGGYHRYRNRYHHHRRHHFFPRFHHHGGREIDRSTCSVQASYLLSYSRQRRYCRYATEEHDDCQACCEAATRRETRGTNKDDIIGFITKNFRHHGSRGKREAGAAYAAASDKSDKDYKGGRDEPEWECVCCIPNNKNY